MAGRRVIGTKAQYTPWSDQAKSTTSRNGATSGSYGGWSSGDEVLARGGGLPGRAVLTSAALAVNGCSLSTVGSFCRHDLRPAGSTDAPAGFSTRSRRDIRWHDGCSGCAATTNNA